MKSDSLTISYLRAHLENLVAEGQMAQRFGLDFTPAQLVEGMESTLLDIIRTSFPLENLLNTSDLVFHAEGPAVRDATPRLSAFNWLSGTAERALRMLSGALFDLSDRDERALRKALDLRLTGMAPGSLYLGFALAAPEADLVPADDEPVFDRVREAVRRLPVLTDAIGDESVLPNAAELIPDAAERDAAFNALLRMSPTGRNGIHTLDMTSPGESRGSLSQRERVVLREAIRRPTLANHKKGTFTGLVRGLDLDSHRLTLREVSGVGSLRCVLPALDKTKAQQAIGEYVSVSGQYETDRQGRPRLLLADSITPLPRPSQVEMPA